MMCLLLLFVHPLFPLGIWAFRHLDQWGLAQVPGWLHEPPAVRAGDPLVPAGQDLQQGALGIEVARRLDEDEWDWELTTAADRFSPLFVSAITAAGVFLYAHSYKSLVTNRRPPLYVPEEWSLARGHFRHETFQCCDDSSYCLMACCCGQTRAADTFTAAGDDSYWSVVLVLVALVLIQGFVQGFILQPVLGPNSQMPAQYLVGSIAACFLANKRKAFRAKFGGGESFLSDCVCYWWCPCCTIIQDARQLDGAQGVRVECCCNLIFSPAAPVMAAQVVGAPVAAAVVMGTVVGPPPGSTGAPVMATVAGPAEVKPNHEANPNLTKPHRP